jgi:hypothetical protein
MLNQLHHGPTRGGMIPQTGAPVKDFDTFGGGILSTLQECDPWMRLSRARIHTTARADQP